MQPPSFEEFVRRQEAATAVKEPTPEHFPLEKCPTPGCNCGQLHPVRKNGRITGFRCDYGCVFSARRNVFTNDITYYKLEEFDVTRIPDSSEVKGMKFNPLGEPYADWF